MITRIPLNSNSIDRSDEIRRVMQDIENKDSSFIWELDGRILEISSPDRDQAIKRGLWLINKLPILAGHHFKVSEGEIERKESS